ncbi:MAG: RNA polymerase sigma factor [Planctomycetota bacterium]
MANLDIEQVIEDYFPRIHRAALVMCGNPWDADDLAQETFLVLAQQRGRFRGQSQLFTYLYGILLNLDRRERRRHGTRRRALRLLQDETPRDGAVQPAADMAVEVSEWKESLWSRVAQLPNAQRETLVLRFSEQLRYEEIAAVLQCPLGTVKSRIFNGLQSLRHILQSESQDLHTAPAHPCEDLTRAI